MLRIRLAGIECAWHSAALEALLSWIDGSAADGSVQLARVSGPLGWRALLRAVARGLSAGEATSDMRLRIYDRATRGIGARDLLSEAFGVATALAARDWYDAVGRVLDADRSVLAIDLVGVEQEECERLLGEVDGVATTLRKMRGDVALPVLVGTDGPWGSSVMPLDVALPELAHLMARNEAARWSLYLHARIAWECGGNPDRALRWGEDCAEARIAQGDDIAFERSLNALASDEWNAVPSTERTTIAEFLDGVSGGGGGALMHALERARYLWEPSGLTQLVPWVARALLRCSTPAFGARRWAREALTCGLLRRDLLQRCLELEGLSRAAFLADPRGSAPAAAQEALRLFAAGAPRSGREWYPLDCPALPADAWDLAGLNDVICSSVVAVEVADMLHELRRVRNSLAHGHYVSWATVTALARIENRLRERLGW